MLAKVDDSTHAQQAFLIIAAAFMLAALYAYNPMLGGPLLLLVVSAVFIRALSGAK